jgi:hypothetical protein
LYNFLGNLNFAVVDFSFCRVQEIHHPSSPFRISSPTRPGPRFVFSDARPASATQQSTLHTSTPYLTCTVGTPYGYSLPSLARLELPSGAALHIPRLLRLQAFAQVPAPVPTPYPIINPLAPPVGTDLGTHFISSDSSFRASDNIVSYFPLYFSFSSLSHLLSHLLSPSPSPSPRVPLYFHPSLPCALHHTSLHLTTLHHFFITHLSFSYRLHHPLLCTIRSHYLRARTAN